MKRVVLLIDGGHLRALARKDKVAYNPDLIEKFSMGCVDGDEDLIRILYYDCAPYSGKAKLPVSGAIKDFQGDARWLNDLAARDLFAVRLGVLKFRGFTPKKTPIGTGPLNDDDFKPDFEQKGVDMRIGLDIATYSASGKVDRIVLVTNDTDCVPAMKHARIAGVQVVLTEFGDHKLASELTWHTDVRRAVKWPN